MSKTSEITKKIRVSNLWSIPQMAVYLNCSASSVYNYESGLRKPRISIIKKYMELAKKKKIDAKIEDFL